MTPPAADLSTESTESPSVPPSVPTTGTTMASAPQPSTSNSETTFNRQLRFSGKPPGATLDKDELPAELFIREVELRRTKYGWSDRATMENVGTMLSGDAAGWLHKGLLMEVSHAQHAKIVKDWSLFQPRFRDQFGVPEDICRVSFSSIEHQVKHESGLKYMARIMDAMADFDFMRFKYGARAPQDGDGDMAVLPLTREILEDIKHDPAKVKHIDNMMANAEFRMAQEQFRVVMDTMIQKIIACGFASTLLKNEAARLFRQKVPLPQFAAEMRAMIRQMEQMNTNKSSAKVAALTAAEDEEEEDSAPVEAIRNKAKTSTGGNSNGNANGRTDNKKNMKCNYCRRKGHFIRECRTRMSNEARRGNSGAAPAPSAAPAPFPLAAVNFRPSGNAGGLW